MVYHFVMKEKQNAILDPEFNTFLRTFLEARGAAINIKSGNDKVIGSAFVYEKIRSSLEYAEDHLIFKNAIARIFWRRYNLGLNPHAKGLVSDLLAELSWADYINPEGVSKEQTEAMVAIVDRYLVFLKNSRSAQISKRNLQKMAVNWLACEIEQLFHPSNEKDIYINYVSSVLAQNFLLPQGHQITDTDIIQLKLAIYALVLKPDYYLMQFWLLCQIYPNWTSMTHEEVTTVARSFDPYFNKVNNVFNSPNRKRYFQFAKINIAPFILLYQVLTTEKIDLDKIAQNPGLLHTRVMEAYSQSVVEARKKVWRGTMRALVFILLTKISLAFIIEIPYDRISTGEINYLTLLINILLPPLLMLVAGTFVKSPSQKNEAVVSEAVTKLLTTGKVSEKRFSLDERKNSRTTYVFNYVYLLFTLLIIIVTVWLLVALGFNIVSIILFFLFVSAVSFFSFRIRNIALELAMKRTQDDALTSTVEFVFLPFIRMGRYLSDQIAAFNPFIIALDFLIEAPLKSILKLTNMWFRFVNAKKEDLEL